MTAQSVEHGRVCERNGDRLVGLRIPLCYRQDERGSVMLHARVHY
jgi:hypothetical protein